MSITVNTFNNLAATAQSSMLQTCCASDAWLERMLRDLPYAGLSALLHAAEENWQGLQRQDYLQAFEAHPRIGDVDSLKEKYRNTQQTASAEQSGAEDADAETLQQLSRDNRVYEEKYGYIFIVCATGKSAAKMLELLQQRLHNDPQQELAIAAAEQGKITRLRLEKLFTPEPL